jgi:PKD repeat protein
MKNKIFKLLICMMLIGTIFIIAPNTIYAEEENGFIYTVSGDPPVATITGYNGTDETITIPLMLGGIPTIHIGDYTFDNDKGHNITSVIIPDSIKSIGTLAFRHCTHLTSATIGSGVSTIGESAFFYCLALTTINVSAGNMNFTSDNGVLCNKNKTTLIQCPGGKTGTVSIPNTITTIGDDAFAYCHHLDSVSIPNSVTTIEYEAFGYCDSLTDVTIPESITYIGPSAFNSCYLLTSMTIVSNVTNIGEYAFDNCYSMTAINVSEGNKNYASVEGVLYNYTKTTLIQCPGGKTGTVNIPSTVTTIGDSAFEHCNFLTNMIIPDNVITIGNEAFINCYNLASVIIGNGVTTIGRSAFHYCGSLTSVIIGNAVTSIGFQAFCSCDSLTSMSIPNKVTTVDIYSLAFCHSLTSVTIGNSVITIEYGTFYDDTNLTSITFLGLIAPKTVKQDWINGTPTNLTGHAYAASDFYEQGNIWNGLTMGDYIPAPPIYGKPSPMNGSTGNQLSLTWRIPINDTEGDQFSWTLECSNGQTSSSTENETNGTKSLSLSGLKNSKQYKVWVNATDPTGSGLYTREWYTFTTKGSSSSGDGNGNGNGGTPPTQNQKPVANLSAGEPYQGIVNTEIIFDGSLSRDPDGNITKWFWNFGDNTNTTGEIVTHTYSQAGTYTVTLTVTDNEGATNTDTTTCTVKQPNRQPTTPIIRGPTNGTKNILYNYTAFSTDADNDTIQYTFNWGDTNSQSSGFLPNATNFSANHSWTAAGRYELTVVVTDNQSASSSKIMVYVDAIQIGEIGYLLDNNTDGRYDAFYSDELQQTLAIQIKDGSYNIDNNGDKKWDYTYSAAKGLIVYKEPSPGFELILVLLAIAIILFLKPKRKK